LRLVEYQAVGDILRILWDTIDIEEGVEAIARLFHLL
jgi:hypothetical protein